MPRRQSTQSWTEFVGPGSFANHLLLNGRSILMFFSSHLATRVGCPRRRKRLAFLRRFRCLLPCFRRKTRPLPVTLKRLATDFLVFAFPATRAIAGGLYAESRQMQWVFDDETKIHLKWRINPDLPFDLVDVGCGTFSVVAFPHRKPFPLWS